MNVLVGTSYNILIFLISYLLIFLCKMFQNKGDALPPVIFNAIRKVQENQVLLKVNGTYQLLAYDDDLNLLGDNINTVKKNTETLPDASKDVGLEINRKN
jgi:hypothetical protein